MSELYTWHEAGTADELNENVITEVALAEKKVALLKKGDNVYAFAATCPHAGARLCEGWLDAAGRVTCPLHKYKFDPVNGRNTSGEGYKLRTYPVQIKEGVIYIGII
jgi:3-phenylpropionate/trans-cinnamate dioxygenase ferredoxin subunit